MNLNFSDGLLGFGSILLYNRLALGVFFPGPPKDFARDKR